MTILSPRSPRRAAGPLALLLAAVVAGCATPPAGEAPGAAAGGDAAAAAPQPAAKPAIPAPLADELAGEPAGSGYGGSAAARAFIDAMVAKHRFDRAELTALFARTRRQDSILAAIARPAEAKPWYQYRTIFLTEPRIRDGARFWEENRATLERAERAYGVPAEVIVAIIGVETRYGANTGNYRVLDALATLAFDYPRRADFFRGELEQFLLLTREEGISPLTPKGSYAGAMGRGQFMPSSFRAYAVDFDGDGKRDLWNNEDAIGSVANYFSRHGWRSGEGVVVPAQVEGARYQPLLEAKLEPPSRTIAALGGYGVRPTAASSADAKANLLRLDGAAGDEYWLGLYNFYVITRYNRSPLYAMAVHQLSQEILAAHRSRLQAAR